MSSRSRVAPYAPLLALLIAVTASIAPGLAQKTAPARTVVIGDIHGDLEGLTGILQQAGITDASGRWTAGATTLVQTGDMTDRGAGVRGVLDLLMNLEPQAKAAGGRLIVLLGNHELMNLAGDYHDVTPAIYATFADGRSEDRRRDAYEAYVRLCAARAELFAGTPPAPFQAMTREAWMEAHPPGAMEYRDAFGPQGRYGRWLRSKSAVLQLGDLVFMHAGINPLRAPRKLDDINKQVASDLRKLDDYRRRMTDRKLILPWFALNDVVMAAQIDAQTFGDLLKIDTWSLFDPEGPMWFRGFAMWTPEEGAPQIKTLLDQYRVAHFVAGHSVTQTRRITPRFSNAVFLIDTGMVFADGAASALEIQDGRFVAIHPDGRTVLVEANQAAPVSR
jgi:hypothetical protein